MAVSGVHSNIEPRLSLYGQEKNHQDIFQNIFCVRIKKICTGLEQHDDQCIYIQTLMTSKILKDLFKMPWLSYFCLIKINLFTSMFH